MPMPVMIEKRNVLAGSLKIEVAPFGWAYAASLGCAKLLPL
jgi:hypothetical protein